MHSAPKISSEPADLSPVRTYGAAALRLSAGFALMLITACTTPDFSEFGTTTGAITAAMTGSQQEAATAAAAYAADLTAAEDPSAASVQTSADALAEQTKKLKATFLIVTAYSQALGGLSTAAGMGEESIKSIQTNVNTALTAINVDTQLNDSQVLALAGRLAGAFTQYEGNKAFTKAMEKSDPVVQDLADLWLQILPEQAGLIEDLAEARGDDARNYVNKMATFDARIDKAIAKRGDAGSIFLPNMAKELATGAQDPANFCLLAVDVAAARRLPIEPYLKAGTPGLTAGTVANGCDNGLIADLPVFLKAVKDGEAREIEKVEALRALYDRSAEAGHRATLATLAAWKKGQLARIATTRDFILVWRQAHSKAFAHVKACDSLRGALRKRCGVLTFDNLKLVAQAAKAIGGTLIGLPGL